MMSKILTGLVLSVGLVVAAVSNAFVENTSEAANPPAAKTEVKSCCEKDLACCNPPSACCVAEKRNGCCAKGMKCCAEKRACCTGVQKCCLEGMECCEQGKACCGPKAKPAK